jgi:hypothetical protein
VSMPTTRAGHAGFTVLEALVALLLSSLIVSLALGALARQRAAVRVLGERGERLAAVRVARHVLGEEGRAAAGEGAWSVGSDSLALRAFRGNALVCGTRAGVPELYVVVAGVRAPDPAKDSVLLVRLDGSVVARALVDRSSTSAPCALPGPGVERWVLSAPVPPDVVAARWFERGAYHLTAGALRYRRGLAGRQPLTPEVLRTPGSGFLAGPAGVSVALVLEGEGAGSSPWAFHLGGAARGRP